MSAAKSYPIAPLERITKVEERLRDENLEVNFSNFSVIFIREMITYFKDENKKSKKSLIIKKFLCTILKSFDTFFVFATTSSSVTLSVTRSDSLLMPISIDVACGLTRLVRNK